MQQRDLVIAEDHAEKPSAMVQVQLNKLALPVGDVVPAGAQ